MNWLKANAYLAAWLSPLVAIVVAIVQNLHAKFVEADWSRPLIYIAFLTALAVIFTPSFAPEHVRWIR
jgi:chromate transport protein ChrA